MAGDNGISSGERKNARKAIDMTAQRIKRESNKPGNKPLSFAEAKSRAIIHAYRRDVKDGR